MVSCPATLRASLRRGGRLTLTALGGLVLRTFGTGEISGDATGLVGIVGQALISSSGDGGGAIQIRGGQLIVGNASKVSADNNGVRDARGGITIDAITATIDSSLVATNTLD
jgi:hypothetical protein